MTSSSSSSPPASSSSRVSSSEPAPPQINRGVLALRDFSPGEELFRVPLRLAITDHVSNKNKNSIDNGAAPAPSSSPTSTSSSSTSSSSSSFDDDTEDSAAGRSLRAEPSAWGARLACRLLREKARGKASPWAPWLAVLPTTTTTTTTTAKVVKSTTDAATGEMTTRETISIVRPGSLRSAWAGALPREVAALLPCPAASKALLAATAAADAEFSRLPRAALASVASAASKFTASDLSSSSSDEEERKSSAMASYRWARAIVQSRTFGSTAKEEGGGGKNCSNGDDNDNGDASSPPPPPPPIALVRMLVPLADFVNHAGDEAESLLSGRAAPTANAVWEVVADDDSDDDSAAAASAPSSWSLVVSATRPLVAGEEISFSYGNRVNADFLVSYGFVPPRNPHDAVCLFESVEEAARWAARRLGLVDEGSNAVAASAAANNDNNDDALSPILSAAAAAAERETPPSVSSAISFSRDPEIVAEASRLRLWAGARVDERLAAALGAVVAEAAAATSTTAGELVAARAAELLSRSGAPPLCDALGELERAGEHEHEEQHYFRALKRRYAAKEAAVRRSAARASEASAAVAVAATALADATVSPTAAPAAPLPPPPPRGGSRSTWRGVRLMALRAGCYSTMILWDALEAADKAASAAEKRKAEVSA